MVELETRLEKVRSLRAQGYNCAQCMAMTFADVTGIDENTAALHAIGLGGGVGGLREICGAVSVMAMVAGHVRPLASPVDKKSVYTDIRLLGEKFVEANGYLTCADLKGMARRPCNEIIESAVKILHEHVASAQ